jgi:protein SCO1/2
MKNIFWRLRWTFLSLIIILGMFQVYLLAHSPAHPLRQWYHSMTTPTPDIPTIGGDFCLTQAGTQPPQPFCTEELRGQYYWVFFGFTYCPDVCPNELAKMINIYDKLPATVQQNLQPVFVSIDPERDTPAVLGDYLRAFSDEVIGLTGSVSETSAVAKEFLVYHAKRPPSDPNFPNEYLVDHSAFNYLMGPDGQYITHFGSHTSAAEIQQQLTEIIFQ